MPRVPIVYFVLSLAASFCSLSCGLPAAPQPPSLELAQPVADLTASREGNRVVLRWTPPRENTDGSSIRNPGQTRVCRMTGSAVMENCTPVGILVPDAPAPSTELRKPPKPHAEFVDAIPGALQSSGGTATYAVEVLNSHGRSAGLSNQIVVPTDAALPEPGTLTAELLAGGVMLSWSSMSGSPPRMEQSMLRVERRVAPAAFVAVAQLPAETTSYQDQAFEWEKSYEYRVRAVTSVAFDGKSATIVSDSSPVATVVTRDVFPPATPAEIQAVYSSVGQKPFIDLVWTASTAADLAGYKVYRREENGTPVKLHSELVKAPAYRDAQVEPGKRYFYTVSAVDLRGNESGKSVEADEVVPNQ